ncbi:MAG TPA: signal peptide peptidase SppA, partial [Rhodospirillaceae bacterium]|nr:signal peptide peptidase SppA [Rhodospirillaceae bacterium]
MNIKQFLLRLFASVGLIMTISIGVGAYATWNFFHPKITQPELPKEMILTLDFTAPVVEQVQDFRLSLPALLEEGGETPLLHIIRALENAKDDPKVKGVIAKFGSEPIDLVHVQEIAMALDHFRASGKFTYAFATSYGDFGPGSGLYSLASHFENIWLQPIGAVAYSAASIEAPFGKSALEKFGVQTDFMRREDYKSVMENVTRDSFSAPVRANMESMLSSLNGQIARIVAMGRRIDIGKSTSLMAGGPYTANEALAAGLVTKLGYVDEITKEVEEKAGKDAEPVDPAYYLYVYNQNRKDEAKGTIAVIYGEGMITDTPAEGPYRLAEDGMIDTASIVGAFDDASKDKDVKAILFRVNSPGGSPVASETIRRALIKAKESKKPIYVSMGSVAASGGYWIAMNADYIVANPATITGSIGVVAGKFVLGEMFDKLGVKFDTISSDGRAGMWSPRTPFDTKGRERMNAMLDETYKAFTDNVSAARKIAPEKMPDVAKGRVFTGEQAFKVGLIDEIGGMDSTILALKKELKLKPTDRVYLQQFPPPETPETLVIRMLHNLRFGGAVVMDFMREFQKVSAALRPVIGMINDNGVIT